MKASNKKWYIGGCVLALFVGFFSMTLNNVLSSIGIRPVTFQESLSAIIAFSISAILAFVIGFFRLGKVFKSIFILCVIASTATAALWGKATYENIQKCAAYQQQEEERLAGLEKTVKDTILGVRLGSNVDEAVGALERQGYRVSGYHETYELRRVENKTLPNGVRGFAMKIYNGKVKQIKISFDGSDYAEEIAKKYPTERYSYLKPKMGQIGSDYRGMYVKGSTTEYGYKYDDGKTTIRIEGSDVYYISDEVVRMEKADEENQKKQRQEDAKNAVGDY